MPAENRLHAPFPTAIRADAQSIATLPRTAGAYLLVMDIPAPVPIHLGGREISVAPGAYCYAGSARGSGGIAARLARHFRADKRPHWHVDALTMVTPPGLALAFPQGDECDLVRQLLENGGASAPYPGFGSSDCRLCRAHLLRLPEYEGQRVYA